MLQNRSHPCRLVLVRQHSPSASTPHAGEHGYSTGNYSGPHNEHHPEDAEGRDGYFDLHLSFSAGAVKRQLLVHERGGYLSEVQEVAGRGMVTGYKLPFWHYTTPLETKSGRAAGARRWGLLGTFPYAPVG